MYSILIGINQDAGLFQSIYMWQYAETSLQGQWILAFSNPGGTGLKLYYYWSVVFGEPRGVSFRSDLGKLLSQCFLPAVHPL